MTNLWKALPKARGVSGGQEQEGLSRPSFSVHALEFSCGYSLCETWTLLPASPAGLAACSPLPLYDQYPKDGAVTAQTTAPEVGISSGVGGPQGSTVPRPRTWFVSWGGGTTVPSLLNPA